MPFYSLRSGPNDGQYRITKFDADLNPESTYEVSLLECSCPAGFRQTCRHRLMLPHFLANDGVDTGKLYNHDDGSWLNVSENI